MIWPAVSNYTRCCFNDRTIKIRTLSFKPYCSESQSKYSFLKSSTLFFLMRLYIGYQTTAVLYENLLPPASNSPFITLLLLSCASFIRWVTSPVIHLVWGLGRDPSCLICRQKKKKYWIHQSSKKTFNLVFVCKTEMVSLGLGRF